MNEKERLILTKLIGNVLFLIGNGATLGFAFVWLMLEPEERDSNQLFYMIVGLYLMASGLWLRRTRVNE
jgi:hypothetical protein